MNRFVYLDNNATTKVASHIKEKILPYLELQYGNPSSVYGHGVKVKQAINESRESIAKLINCSSNNIVFTSGGTESNCSAFNSAINELSNRKKIITTKVEHGSILKYCGLLEDRGYKVVYLDVDKNCKVNMKQLEEEVDENTALVSIQYANNEVGTILLDDELLYLIKNLKNKYKFKFHTDCVQGFGKVSIDYQKLDADYISFSGHKIHCPKGIGSLYIKEPKFFVPLITGSQEFGLRGGTENVIGIVAMGEACKLLHSNLTLNTEKVKEIRNYLEVQLMQFKNININCREVARIYNTTSITFNNIAGNNAMFKLEQKGICVSTGSACNSESSQPSHVLVAMGVKSPGNTIRISIDETTTKSQIDYFIENLKQII